MDEKFFVNAHGLAISHYLLPGFGHLVVQRNRLIATGLA